MSNLPQHVVYSSPLQRDYISLLKSVLIGLNRINKLQFKPTQKLINNQFTCLLVEQSYEQRLVGRDWPLDAETMIGLKRMENVEFCVNEVIKNQIPGDFLETGVWRGGTCIFVRGILKALGISNKTVWVADSFQGLPTPNVEQYPEDMGDILYSFNELQVSEEDVRSNFETYNLLDNQVKFLKGWFKDTMPIAPIEKLSVLRLDGDMYESTIDVLLPMYPKLSIGGYCIVDDWGAIPACKQAVEDYRLVFDLDEEVIKVDWTGVYFKKTRDTKVISIDEFRIILAEKKRAQLQKRSESFRKLPLLFKFNGDLYQEEGVVIKNIDDTKISEGDFGFLSTSNDPMIILPELKLAEKERYCLSVELTVDKTTKLQVFFKTKSDNKYSEHNSQKHWIEKGRNRLIFEVREDEIIGSVRLDPGDFIGSYILHNLEIRSIDSFNSMFRL
ncbi:MAG: macrocin O-methyltransferase [Salinivirgaceae bacterium]|nr:macrocin O-methyltransferase [Salinivirgaceae bacterium]MDD4747807.1 macrocin O-methyltransferase [Salinivirgaceae bacterium]MDY0279816.1 TylF/MycF/NovP-related O-methyltransferase [Salinivirgaceae bacterium]